MPGESRRPTREQLAEYGRRGAAAKWAKPRPGQPYPGTFLDFLDAVGMTGPSWAAWRVFWKAVDALPMDEGELALFRAHTGRQAPPANPVRECWIVAGRRSGKSRNMAARATWTGIRRDWRAVLARGERATIPLIASDRKQASVALGYIGGFLELEAFAPYVLRTLREAVVLGLGANIEVHTCSFKSVRGFTCPLVLGDETAYWQTDDGAASPDAEVLQALKPTMTTIPDALLLAGSTPYARVGAVWRAYERHFGRADSDALCWVADTVSMHPVVDRRQIDELFADDPARALSEYGQGGLVQFRQDVESFLSREAVEAVTVPGRRELPPVPGLAYVAFVDVSGGSGDSYTVAVAHRGDDGVAVLDVLREVRPPFSPEQVTAEYAALVKRYGCTSVTGDKYGGEFPRELYAKQGIMYVPSERTKGDIYHEVLAPINSRAVALLDHPRLKAQLVGLERRTGRSGKDSIDHVEGGHDDVANVACGALLLAGGGAPGDGWIAYLKAEVIRTGGPLPASASDADRAAAGRRMVVLDR